MTRTRFPWNALFGAARTLACAAAVAFAVAGCGGSGGGNGGRDRPALSLSASPTTIALGQSSTLTWNSSAGTSCTASGEWSGAKSASGTEAVTPDTSGTKTYTLTCSGGAYSDDATASATLTVNAPSAFSATALVADTAGGDAITTDANVANAWGLAFGPTTPLWVANNHTDTSTVYDGNGRRQPLAAPLVVHLPEPSAGVDFEPTGIVFNGTTDFAVSAGANTAPARFILAGEGGAIAGWAPSVNAANAVIAYAASDGAAYTGLALASNGTANFLYAADFANGKVDVFDAAYARQPTSASSFSFTDPSLPEGYAPFGIQAVANGAGGATQLYVTYARKDADGEEVRGAGLGIVSVFDADGGFVKRLVSDGGRLDAPWGIALAPADFGTLGDMLLVGNFGDGTINGFDPATGDYVGTVVDADGNPFAVPGLWGLAFGNDTNNQPRTTLFYAAGTNDEVNGVVGRIDVGATPPVLNDPPVVAITAPTGTVSGTKTITATATSDTGIAKVEFFVGGVSLGSVTSPPYSIDWDTTTRADGAVNLTATATDSSGNVGTSPAVTVTVQNAAATVTLSQLQASVFTPKCSGCHTGVGSDLPGSMDLTAGHSHASLVNVASEEKPALMRVKPGEPNDSYLVHKLEGGPDIDGSRMPFGGPFLDQATIDDVRAWIASGAAND